MSLKTCQFCKGTGRLGIGPFRRDCACLLRRERLMPAGNPRYVHCYDNGGETEDRYTIVFTGRYRKKTGGVFWHIGASAAPFHPQGIGMHGESRSQLDYPRYGHLGRKVSFLDLPADVQRFTRQVYVDLWDLTLTKEK